MVTRVEKNKSKRREINKKERDKKRKKILSSTSKVFIWLIIILSISYIILRYVGNYGLVVKEEALVYEKLPEEFHGLKIIHFSDLHYGMTIDIKKLDQIVEKINNTNPDIIVFTGDLVDRYTTLSKDEIKQISEKLNKLEAKLGKYIVQGNHDKKHLNDIISNTDFMLLDNNYDLIYNEGYTPILITGIGSSILNNVDIDKAYSYFNKSDSNKEIFTISLMHEPDNIDKILEKYNVDLVLSGHSHNGQVRLPFAEALVKVEGAKKYYEEKYIINNTTLLISGGIGTSNYPFRLFNHPSINFIRLRTY